MAGGTMRPDLDETLRELRLKTLHDRLSVLETLIFEAVFDGDSETVRQHVRGRPDSEAVAQVAEGRGSIPSDRSRAYRPNGPWHYDHCCAIRDRGDDTGGYTDGGYHDVRWRIVTSADPDVTVNWQPISDDDWQPSPGGGFHYAGPEHYPKPDDARGGDAGGAQSARRSGEIGGGPYRGPSREPLTGRPTRESACAGPYTAPSGAPSPTLVTTAIGALLMSRLSEKAKLVADGQKSLATATEAQFDAMLAKQADAKSRMDTAMQKIAAVQADIDGGTSEIENVAAQLTNQ